VEKADWIVRFEMMFKVKIDWASRILVGNELQICGAEMRKAQDLKDRLCRGFIRVGENPMSAEA